MCTCRIKMQTDNDFEKANKLMSQAVGRVKASEARDTDEVGQKTINSTTLVAPPTTAATSTEPMQPNIILKTLLSPGERLMDHGAERWKVVGRGKSVATEFGWT